MQAGFAMLCAGSVRRKNAQNTMLKNLLDACGAAIAFFCVGYAFAFGGGYNRLNLFVLVDLSIICAICSSRLIIDSQTRLATIPLTLFHGCL